MNLKTSRLRSVLVSWTVFTAVFPTLIVYRGAVDPEYQWGLFGIVGVGMSPGFAVVAAAAAWAWVLVVLGQRRSTAFPMPTVGWNAFLFLTMILGVAEWGSDMVLRGDAYGLRINLAVAGPLITGLMFVLSIVLLRRERLRQSDALLALPRNYRRALGFALCLAPVILLLFSLGPGGEHTNLDRVAVALTIAQSIAIASALDASKAGNDRLLAPPVD